MTMPIREASPREASMREAPADRRESADPRQADDPQPAGNGAGAAPGFDSRDWLTQATGEMRDSFARNRRVISFAEYVTLFSAEPARQLRSAAQYVRDVFDHFGSEPVRTPRGPMTRWSLFDCPWDNGKDALVGQEEVQAAVYRLVANFARVGRTNRLILLHGPNGSAK
jgi:serine protein kinase